MVRGREASLPGKVGGRGVQQVDGDHDGAAPPRGGHIFDFVWVRILALVGAILLGLEWFKSQFS